MGRVRYGKASLLDKGANVNIYERYGGTPLHSAIDKGR